jgi:hypothetical protein
VFFIKIPKVTDILQIAPNINCRFEIFRLDLCHETKNGSNIKNILKKQIMLIA